MTHNLLFPQIQIGQVTPLYSLSLCYLGQDVEQGYHRTEPQRCSAGDVEGYGQIFTTDKRPKRFYVSSPPTVIHSGHPHVLINTLSLRRESKHVSKLFKKEKPLPYFFGVPGELLLGVQG